MVDPVQIGLSAVAGRAASRALNSMFGPEQGATPKQLGSDGELTSLPKASGRGTAAILTTGQLKDIEDFIETRQVASLVQSWCLMSVSDNGRSDDNKLIRREITETFIHLAKQWNFDSSHQWISLAPIVWRLITETLGTVARGIHDGPHSTVELRHLYQTTTSAVVLRGRKRSQPIFLRNLLDALSTPQRAGNIKILADDINEHARLKYAELELNHVQDRDYRFSLSELYVTRTLRSRATGEEIDSQVVTAGLSGTYRAVILGDPGVGKSTLVRHLVHSQATASAATTRAPIVVECRDYAGSSWGTRLTAYISNRLSTDLDRDIAEREVLDLLTVGASYLIFDGIDEIIDIQQRREFVKLVEALLSRCPLLPALVTSRKIGYDRAKFRDEVMNAFELNEFSDAQIDVYLRKWFALTKRSDLERESFERESIAVADIRSNPLMLSLLCTLYRARGHIPRNRRQVYRDCSDLLFSRWDAMRHVEQPYDHRQYGERLMQELARFFYKSQSAQVGLEEDQLIQIIANFFRDTASVDPPEHVSRARQFLDFCADRAWLLSAKGTNGRGVRLFGFTHRTFMEYMAAEALARNARSIDEIVDEIVRVFSADPSSVLPDVLVQCVDDKFDRGAETVLQNLFARGRKATYGDKYLSLCLRIVNSTPMSRAISEPLPMEVWSSWHRTTGSTYDSSCALFELYRDPRNKIVKALSEPPEPKHLNKHPEYTSEAFRDDVCVRWAQLDALESTRLFDPEWPILLTPHFEMISTELLQSPSVIASTYNKTLVDVLIANGFIRANDFTEDTSIQPRLLVSSFNWQTSGSVVRSFVSSLRGGASTRDIDVAILEWSALHYVSRKWSPGLAGRLADTLAEEVRYWPQQTASRFAEIGRRTPAIRSIGFWLACMMAEAWSPSLHPLHDVLDGVIGIQNFRDLVATREKNLGVESELSGRPLSKPFLTRLLQEHGLDATRWALGKTSVLDGDVSELT